MQVGDHVWADFGDGKVLAHITQVAHTNAAGEEKYGVQAPDGSTVALGYREPADRDAHHMGVRGWNEGPGIPSPYEQAMAVIGHVRLYGDGFTGRCSGIARSSWN